MEIADFKEVIDLIPRISTTRKYWLVRTQGGLYYDDFKTENFIAIGYNQINLIDINESRERVPNHPENFLSVIVKGKITDEKQPRYAAKQLLKFVYEIKKGDIVLIPSFNSRTVSIGEVTDSIVHLDNDAPNVTTPKGGSKKCPYIKRKPVKWLKEVKRAQLDPLLYKLLFSHHFISDGSAYDNIIDNMLHDLYIKGREAYLVLDVATQRDILARNLFDTGSQLLNIVDEYSAESDIEINSDGIDVKLALRSPGNIQLSGKQVTAILLIALGILFINGGGFTSKKFGLSLKTNGLFKNLTEFLDGQHKREMKTQLLEENIKKLQVKSPDDLKKIMEALEIKENNSKNSDVKED